ncbi:hypothetical protein B484DRAFT_392125 [Ochromonadaceae sp. CCMP2298]|nr:hypothetical protein B484DRAFT_392125 [Ochromonadaceae sp. CCMP2298]
MLALLIIALALASLGDAFAPKPVTHFEALSVPSGRNIVVRDITKEVAEVVSRSGCQEGVVTVMSKHSTVGVGVNEMEGRFVDDLRQFLLRMAPPSYPWLHNDIDNRCLCPL